MKHDRSRTHAAEPESLSPLLGIILALMAVVCSACISFRAVAADSGNGGVRTAIIENPPKPGSRVRTVLMRAAGSPRIAILEMSKGEAWSIGAKHHRSFKSTAARYGIRITDTKSSAMSPMLVPMRGKMKMSAEQRQMMTLAKTSNATMGVMMARTPDPAAMEYLLTRGMNDPDTAQAPPIIELAIDGTRKLRLIRTRIERASGRWIWHGVVEGTDQHATLVWWPSGRLSGTITHKSMMYSIREMGAGMHALIEIDPNRMPMEHAPSQAMRVRGGDVMSDPLVRTGEAITMRPAEMQKGGAGAIPIMEPVAGEVVIDLLIAYTKAARRHYSDIERDLLTLAVDETNRSFRNSKIENVRLRLVHAYETSYVENGGHFDHIWRLADKGDGIMEEIHQLRDAHKADVALLIVDDRVGCGLATRVAADADEAFAVVHHECAATSYTLAHEVGHIIGARHDRALDQNSHPFEFGHGYVHGTEWRTMMSYKQSCNNCPRLPFWSSPTVRIRGVPAGSDRHNNAKAIALGAARVAGFR